MSHEAETVTLDRFCSECGHLNRTATDYCLNCGAPLGAAAAGEPDMMSAAAERDTWRVYGVASPFAGRDAELEQLVGWARGAFGESRATVVLIEGPAGIGKTRLLDVLNERLVEGDSDVLMPKAHIAARDRAPYDAFVQILRERFYVPRGASAAEARSRIEDGVRSLVGDAGGADVARHIGRFVAPENDEVGTASGHRGWRKALVRVLREDAKRNPLALTFDDLHNAGAETIELVAELVPALGDLPVTFFLSATEGANLSTLTERIGTSRLHRMALRPLDDGAVDQLVRGLLTRVSDLPDELVDRIATAAVGLPLSAEELVRLLIAEGIVDTRGDTWSVDADRAAGFVLPVDLEGLIRARLDVLDADELRLLAFAATLGRRFWLGALVALDRIADTEAALDIERDDERRETLAGRLAALERRDILREVIPSSIPGEREFVFKHTLEQQVLADELDAGLRTGAHRVTAQWLEVHASTSSERMLVAIAEHYEAGGLTHRAVDAYRDAAARHRARHVHERALRYLERALAALDPLDLVARADVLLDLGSVCLVRGRYEEAAAYFDATREAAWRIADQRRHAAALAALGRARRGLGGYDEALQLAVTAEALFQTIDDEPGVAEALTDAGRVYWLRGAYDEAQSRYDRALAIRRTTGDGEALADALHHVGTLLVHRGRFQPALDHFREALEIRKRRGDLAGIAESLNTIGVIFTERGDQASAHRLWKEALDVARTAGDRILEGILLNNLGEIEIGAGRLDEAEERLQQAASIAEAAGDRRVLFDAIRNLGVLQAARGNQTLALDHADEALELARSLGSGVLEGIALRTLGELHARTLFDASGEGGASPAEEAFRGAIDRLREIGNEAELGRTYHSYGTFLIERQELLQGRKHLEMAREIFERLEMRRILARTEQTIGEL